MTDFIGDVIEAVGPLGLALLLAAEAFFPPLPSEAMLPLAGFFVEQGRLSFVPALLGATTGSLVAALAFYALGRYGGRPLILSQRRWLHVGERELDMAERWFDRWGPAIVFLARLIPIVRSVISIPAGTMRMNVATFTVLTALGSAIWNAALISAGWALGSRWHEARDLVSAWSPVIVAVVAVGCVAAGVWFWRRRRRREAAGGRAPAPPWPSSE